MGREGTSLEPSRRLCVSGSVIHPLTRTLASTNCPTFEMRSCITPLPQSQVTPIQLCPTMGSNPPHHRERGLTACIAPTTLVSMVLHKGMPILAPCVSLHTSIGAICGKYNFGKYNIFPQTWQRHVVCHGKSLSVLLNIPVHCNLWWVYVFVFIFYFVG